MDINNENSLNNTDLFIIEDRISKLGVIASKIAYHNFEWRFFTLVMFNTVHAIGLQTFLNNYNQTVVVKLGRFVPKHRANVPQFVIFGEDSTEISTTIRWLVDVKYDSNAKFIIICASYDKECYEEVIFQALVNKLVLNVIVLKASNLNDEPLAYSYRIALPGKCKNAVPDELDLKSDCGSDKCFKALFPEKLTNFYKCRLVISTVEQPPFMYLHNGTMAPSGTDGDIIKLVANMLNATLVLKTPSDGTDIGYYINNNWTGSLGDIFNRRGHVSACSAPLSAYKYGNFQISFTYYSMDMVWAAKLPTQKPAWEKLLYPLKFEVRILLLFTFIAIILMNVFKDTEWWRKVRIIFRMNPPKYNLLFYSWLLFLGMPILKISPTKSFRIAVFIWIWCCFILRSAYQASLIDFLKHPAYHDKLKTFREVLKDGYPFGGLASARDYYYEDRTIYDNWIHVGLEHLDETLDEILAGTTDFVIAANKNIIRHRILKFKGTKQLQIIPEKIVNSPTVVYFSKYSPLPSPVSYILRIAVEAGFVQRLYGRYVNRERALLERYRIQIPEPLSLCHFAGCFVVLIIGWLLATIYFAVEYVCGHLDEDEQVTNIVARV